MLGPNYFVRALLFEVLAGIFTERTNNYFFIFENFISVSSNFYFLKTLSTNIFQAFPLLLADIDPSGNMNAQIIHGPTDRTRLKFMSQIMKKKWEGVQMSADYKGDTWTSSLTLANPDLT